MANETNISWTDATFSPWRGCQKISKGCENCYADTFSHRNPKLLGVFGTEAQGGTRVVASDDMWRQPLKWNAQGSSRVFCASIADVFEDWSGPMLNHKGEQLYRNGEFETPLTMDDVRRRLFDLIDATPNLTWQLLTKRPENIRRMWQQAGHPFCTHPADDDWAYSRLNVWLGTTVENQEAADNRLPELLENSDLSPVQFLSMEPLLGNVDLRWPEEINPFMTPLLNYIQWIIVGCESGSHRRDTKIEWVRDLRDQCKAAGVAFFVKQLEIDGKVATDINQFPEDLRIQEFPNQ